MESYDELRFQARINAALKTIKTVLENTRNPQFPPNVPHEYADKYLLVEFLGGTTIASLLASLETIGLGREQLATLREWSKTRSVTLRLQARESCAYLREEVRTVEPSTQTVRETTSGSSKKTTTEKVITRVTEHFWKFDFAYAIVAYQGNAPDGAIALLSRSGSVEIKTSAKTTPRPKETIKPSRDANITWLLQHLDAESRASFAIDRAKAKTPRRNDEVDAAMTALEELHGFCSYAKQYFLGDLFAAQPEHGRDLRTIDDAQVFVPVVPLFEEGTSVLPATNANDFLAEERRSLAAKHAELASIFPADATCVTVVEAKLLVTLMHAMRACQHFSDGVDYVEGMLRKQLVAAIGKEIGPAEFSDYMEFHHRKLLKPEYRPQPFSYAIRRPDHYPEGVLSIEAAHDDEPAPIFTTVTHTKARKPMSFALDAATRVSFNGDRYLHAWISHQFSGQESLGLALMARARQFSSFILLVGRIASADVFEPKHAIILQNKDLVAIPLMLEQIPTPKEFRDAIESLSPEQQRFAKAFRSMQLESTLFGVCVIQIKPQLEKLLKLPPDSLTKEIKMTEELLDLFIQYQIPSDLLAYAGPDDAPAEDKIARVKDYTAKMHEMIAISKQKQLDEEREREAFRLAQQNRTPVYPAAAPGGFGGPPMPPPAMAPMPVMRSGTAAPPPQMVEEGFADELSMDAPSELFELQASVSGSEPSTTSSPTQQTSTTNAGSTGEADPDDYTRVPGQLDAKLEALDTDGALRATIINPGDTWMKRSQRGLLGAPEESELYEDEQRTEKNRAFDLLDALTRSGSLSVDEASLHVVLAATHCFDQTLLDTVICENVNPIEKVERSLLIVGTTIHKLPAADLLAPEQKERFFTTSPQLGPGDK